MTTAERPTVTVVIPVRDGAAVLDTCLTAVGAQDYPRELLQVVVVDNASVEDIGAVVARHDRVELRHQPSGGSYAARNLGLQHAHGEVIAFTDGDCEPASDWLSAAVASLMAPPRAAMVGGAMALTYPGGRPVTASELYESVHGFQQRYYLEQSHYAVTANMVTWRSTLDQVGVFDGTLFSRGDAEWGQRVASAGGLQRYAADAVVRHPARSTLGESSRKWKRVAVGQVAVHLARGTSRFELLKVVRWQWLTWLRALRGAHDPPHLRPWGPRLRYLGAFTLSRLINATVYTGGLLRTLRPRTPVGHRGARAVTRVVYTGAVVSNGGDAAIMAAQIATLDGVYPGHTAVLHDSHPEVAGRLFPSCEVLPATGQVVALPRGKQPVERRRRTTARLRLLGAALLWRVAGGRWARGLLRPGEAEQIASLDRADLVAYTGGTTLIEKYDVEAKTLDIRVARALGKPVVLLPQSLGPFAAPRNQRLVRRALAGAALILLRDERSKVNLTRIGVPPGRLAVVPDVVFALTTDAAADAIAAGRFPARGPRVAVSMRDCLLFFAGDASERAAAQAGYEAAVAALVTYLVRERGAAVTFLSTCQGVPEYWADDSAVAATVVGSLPADVAAKVVVDRGHHDPEDIRDTYAGFDLVVCTRLHAAILALAGGTPVLPIAYEFKTHEVMGQLGLGDHVLDVQEVDAANLLEAFERLVADLPTARPLLAARLAAMAADARSTGDRVRAALSGARS